MSHSEPVQGLAAELAAIKRMIERVEEKQAAAKSSSDRNGFKIEALEAQIAGKDGIKDDIRGLKDRIDAIRDVMPDLKTTRNLVVGFVTVLLGGFATWVVSQFSGGK